MGRALPGDGSPAPGPGARGAPRVDPGRAVARRPPPGPTGRPRSPVLLAAAAGTAAPASGGRGADPPTAGRWRCPPVIGAELLRAAASRSTPASPKPCLPTDPTAGTSSPHLAGSR